MPFCNQNVDGCSLRFIILLGNIQNRSPNHLRYVTENVGQSFRVILLVNVADIVLFFPFCLCITDVKNVKAQRLCEIVMPASFPTLPSQPSIKCQILKLDCSCIDKSISNIHFSTFPPKKQRHPRNFFGIFQKPASG